MDPIHSIHPSLYTPLTASHRRSPELELAFEERDDQRVWAETVSGLEPAKHYDAIRAHAFNATSSTQLEGGGAAAVHSALFLWPVILDHRLMVGQVDRSPRISGDSTGWIARQFQTWTDYKSSLCLLQNLFSYHYVACNGPVMLRQVLDQMTQRTPIDDLADPIHAQHFESQVPDDAPVLHFMIGTLSRLGEWPLLRQASQHQTLGLTSEVEAALQVQLCDSRDAFAYLLQLGVPEFADTAIESGLKAWLSLLNDQYPFQAWSVEPQGGDRVDLCIELTDTTSRSLRLPLRTYQLGVQGVVRVLAHVAALAAVKTPSRMH